MWALALLREFYTILYYTILYYTILHYTIAYHTIPYHTTQSPARGPHAYSLLLYTVYSVVYFLPSDWLVCEPHHSQMPRDRAFSQRRRDHRGASPPTTRSHPAPLVQLPTPGGRTRPPSGEFFIWYFWCWELQRPAAPGNVDCYRLWTRSELVSLLFVAVVLIKRQNFISVLLYGHNYAAPRRKLPSAAHLSFLITNGWDSLTLNSWFIVIWILSFINRGKSWIFTLNNLLKNPNAFAFFLRIA